MILTAKQIDEAWAVIGATNAGRNARVKLQSVLTGLAPNPGDASALSQHEGKRILALELLQLMDASFLSGRADSTSADDYAAPRREPIARPAARSLRRVPLDDPGDGRTSGE